MNTVDELPKIPDSPASATSPAELGIAVDAGTTTIAVSVWSLSKRKHLATIAEKNNQVKFGYDSIKRVSFALRPPLTGSSDVIETGHSALHYCIISQLEKMFSKAVSAAAEKLPEGTEPVVKNIVITGSTAMLCFICAVPVEKMASAPFTSPNLFDLSTTWEFVRTGSACERSVDLDKPTPELIKLFDSSVIPPHTEVYFPPCVSTLIGADSICSMITAGFSAPGAASEESELRPWESKVKAPLLLADIGTASEFCIFIPATETETSRIICTSASSGPALEAANISCGMSSVNGAINNVTYKNGEIECSVIGNGTAKGICSAGLVSAVASFCENKIIDKNGIILKPSEKLGDGTTCIELTPAVYISQQDIKNIQLAKSVVRTGLEYLLEETKETPVFCLAGSFGTKFNLKEAAKIGLVPAELEKRTIQLGNAALSGASALLFSLALKEKGRRIAKSAEVFNLVEQPDFQERFLKSIDF